MARSLTPPIDAQLLPPSSPIRLSRGGLRLYSWWLKVIIGKSMSPLSWPMARGVPVPRSRQMQRWYSPWNCWRSRVARWRPRVNCESHPFGRRAVDLKTVDGKPLSWPPNNREHEWKVMKVTSGWNGVPYFQTNPKSELLGLNRRSVNSDSKAKKRTAAVVDAGVKSWDSPYFCAQMQGNTENIQWISIEYALISPPQIHSNRIFSIYMYLLSKNLGKPMP